MDPKEFDEGQRRRRWDPLVILGFLMTAAVIVICCLMFIWLAGAW